MAIFKKAMAGLIGLIFFGCAPPASVVIEPLRVVNWSPTSGAFCVGVDADIYLTFSDDLDPSSLSSDAISLVDSDGAVATELTYDAPALTALLHPTTPLRFERLHTVKVTTAVRGKNVGAMSVELEASFLTIPRNGCAPAVQCTRPSDCPGTLTCSNVGVCVAECVTDEDCWQAICDDGTCVPADDSEGPDGDADAGGD